MGIDQSSARFQTAAVYIGWPLVVCAYTDHGDALFTLNWMQGLAGLYCLRDRFLSVIVYSDD